MSHVPLSSPDFLARIYSVLQQFDYKIFPDVNMPQEGWKKLLDAGVLLPMLPSTFDGRDSHEEMCQIIRQAAYHNLALAMFIVTPVVIFSRTLLHFGPEALQREVFNDILTNGHMAGFAAVDPESSGAITMRTLFEAVPGGYRIVGRKHWQGYSLTAEWWLVVAKDSAIGVEGDKVDFFICRKTAENFRTVETYHPFGLGLIDFGLNEVDMFVPESQRLDLRNMDITGLLNVITGAWGQWSAMGNGFLTRVYEAANQYTTDRPTRTGKLKDHGHVKYRLGVIAACRDNCRALFNYVQTFTSIQDKLTEDMFPLQAVKALSADYMFTGSNHYLELCGGEGYRHGAASNFAARAMEDARGFSILGGANDMLYAMLTQYCLQTVTTDNFFTAIALYPHTSGALHHITAYQDVLQKLPEENLERVFCGKILSRLFMLQQLGHSSHLLTEVTYQSAITWTMAELSDILHTYTVAGKISAVAH